MAKLKKLPSRLHLPTAGGGAWTKRVSSPACNPRLGPAFAATRVRGLKVKRDLLQARPQLPPDLRSQDPHRDREPQGEQFYYGKILAEPKPASHVPAGAHKHISSAPRFGPPVALARRPRHGGVGLSERSESARPGDCSPIATRSRRRVERDPAAFGLPAGGTLEELRSGVGKYVPGTALRLPLPRHLAHARRRANGAVLRQGLPARVSGAAPHDILAATRRERCRAAVAACGFRRRTASTPNARSSGKRCCRAQSFAKEATALDLAALAGPVASALAAFHATPSRARPGARTRAGVGRTRRRRRARSSAPTRSTRRAVAALRAAARGRGAGLAAGAAGAGARLVQDQSHLRRRRAGRLHRLRRRRASEIRPTTSDVSWRTWRSPASSSKTDAESDRAALERFRAAYSAGVPWGWPDDAGALVHGGALALEPSVQVRQAHGAGPRRCDPGLRRVRGSRRAEGGRSMVDIKDVPRDACWPHLAHRRRRRSDAPAVGAALRRRGCNPASQGRALHLQARAQRALRLPRQAARSRPRVARRGTSCTAAWSRRRR